MCMLVGHAEASLPSHQAAAQTAAGSEQGFLSLFPLHRSSTAPYQFVEWLNGEDLCQVWCRAQRLLHLRYRCLSHGLARLSIAKASRNIQMLSRSLYKGILIGFHVLIAHDHDLFRHEILYWFSSRELCVSVVKRSSEEDREPRRARPWDRLCMSQGWLERRSLLFGFSPPALSRLCL